jgi:hypothetical protein
MGDDTTTVLKLSSRGANKEKLDVFMVDFKAEARPLHGNFYVWKEKVMFELYPFNGSIHLGAIQSPVERGYASPALDWLVSLATKHGVIIEGAIKRLGKDGLTHGQLRSWYARHGFKIRHNINISYAPINSSDRSAQR